MRSYAIFDELCPARAEATLEPVGLHLDVRVAGLFVLLRNDYIEHPKNNVQNAPHLDRNSVSVVDVGGHGAPGHGGFLAKAGKKSE